MNSFQIKNQKDLDALNQGSKNSMTADEIYLYVKSMVNPDKHYIDELYNFALLEHEQKNYDTAIKYYCLIKKESFYLI